MLHAAVKPGWLGQRRGTRWPAWQQQQLLQSVAASRVVYCPSFTARAPACPPAVELVYPTRETVPLRAVLLRLIHNFIASLVAKKVGAWPGGSCHRQEWGLPRPRAGASSQHHHIWVQEYYGNPNPETVSSHALRTSQKANSFNPAIAQAGLAWAGLGTCVRLLECSGGRDMGKVAPDSAAGHRAVLVLESGCARWLHAGPGACASKGFAGCVRSGPGGWAGVSRQQLNCIRVTPCPDRMLLRSDLAPAALAHGSIALPLQALSYLNQKINDNYMKSLRDDSMFCSVRRSTGRGAARCVAFLAHACPSVLRGCLPPGAHGYAAAKHA